MIQKLENESEKNRLEIKRLTEAKERLEEAVSSLNCKLEELNACEIIRKKTDECVKICIAGISKCQKCVKRLIDFINEAISKKFLDPSLLFSAGDGKSYTIFHQIVFSLNFFLIIFFFFLN